jgi:hypothetical protein
MSSMTELVQSALSALRHLQPADPATAAAILNLWAHVAEIDVDQVVNYYFTGGRTDVTVVAGGRLVSHCCGRIDDEPHRSFCEHYVAGDGYAEGYLDALDAVKKIRDERRRAAETPECPEWCTLTHDPDDDACADLALHMGDDHTDTTVRKLLDGHHLEVQVTRTDSLSEGKAGTPNLYVRCELELRTWEQAAELARTILDGFGYLEAGAL